MTNTPQNITVRTTAPIANSFKDKAHNLNMSHHEYLSYLLAHSEASEQLKKNVLTLPEPEVNTPPYPIELLICDGNLSSTTLSFDGELVTMLPSSRPFHAFESSKKYFSELLKKEVLAYAQHNDYENTLGLDASQIIFDSPNYTSSYQYALYKLEYLGEIHYLIYEFIAVMDIPRSINLIHIKRAYRTKTLTEIIQHMIKYLSTAELDVIKHKLSPPCNFLDIPQLP